MNIAVQSAKIGITSIILLHLEMGARFYAEKTDSVGDFVSVYGGGDAANRHVDGTGSRDRNY